MGGVWCGVWGLGCGVQGVGCGVWSVGCGVGVRPLGTLLALDPLLPLHLHVLHRVQG